MLKSRPTRSIAYPHLLTFAVVAVAFATGGCGGLDPGANAPPPKAMGRFAAKSASGTFPTYTPAAAACASPSPAIGPPGPLATTVRISGYRACGPFIAGAGRSSFTCTLASGAIGPYRVLAYNGRKDGSHRAKGSVRLNGKRIIGEDSFQHGASAATLVELGSSNTLEVRTEKEHERGEDGRSSDPELTLVVADEGQSCLIAPLAKVTERTSPLRKSFSPANAFAVPELQVFGADPHHDHPEHVSISLNGETLVRGKLRKAPSAVLLPVTLSAQNALTASVRHEGAIDLRLIDWDATPPALTIEGVADGFFTNQPQLGISGTIDDPSAAVTVNGTAATSSSGRYTAGVNLSPCWNTITVRAADTCANSSEAVVRVGLDTQAPVLAIMSPPSGVVTNQVSIPVTLRYSDDFSGLALSSVHVTLDGVEVTGILSLGDDAAAGALVASDGPHRLHVQLSDRAGNAASAETSFLEDRTPPTLSVVTPGDGSGPIASPVALTVKYEDVLSGVDLSSLSIALDGQDVTASFAAGPVSASASLAVPAGVHRVEARVSDGAANVATGTASFEVSNASPLPPDPRKVAPPNDLTVPTDIAGSTAFLYTGPNPIQTGVAPGTIEPLRVAVIRGHVGARDGTDIGGVKVTIVGHPEYGSTLTRADGVFDLAVNGGGVLTIGYERDGYLRSQRQVQARWRDYVWAAEVVLVPYDTQVSAVALGASAIQEARGTVVSDEDGTRQAAVLFPAGTGASMVMPDGTTQALPGVIHVRATEYTVGSTGPKAMPAPLPPTSGYTYAVALTVDEAAVAGARSVQFDRAVPVYVENFLGLPAGWPVPSGYYDPARAQWVASDDGRVVQILSDTGGMASIDADGDGFADGAAALAALGFTDQELQLLASSYPPGQTLWRMPVTHFTDWDFNCAWACAKDSAGESMCKAPAADDPMFGGEREKSPSCTRGSIIECQSQVLGESVSIVGTPFSLSYRSEWQGGRVAGRLLTIQLPKTTSGAAANLALEVEVAGQRLTGPETKLPATQTGTVTYLWDGLDAYGRRYQGDAPVIVRLGYVYPVQSVMVRSGNGRGFGGAGGSSMGGNMSVWPNYLPPEGHFRSETHFAVWRTWTGTLQSWTALPLGLGGWTLNEHASYSPESRTVRHGDGRTRTAEASTTITTILGQRNLRTPAEGVPASDVWFQPSGMAFAPDGSLYVSGWANGVWRIDTSGLLHPVTGTGSLSPYKAEGAPAASVGSSGFISDIATANDGTLYVATYYGGSVWRIDPEGRFHAFAGGGTASPGDGGPASKAAFGMISSIAVGPDGSVFIRESDRLRRVAPDGTLSTIAGGPGTVDADNVPAVKASVSGGDRISTGADGSIYLGGRYSTRIRRIGPDGIVRPFAGTRESGFSGDGGQALAARLRTPFNATPAPDGSVLIADSGNCRIREVRPDGVIRTIAGNGVCNPSGGGWGDWGDGRPPLDALVNYSVKAAVGPDGAIYIVDLYAYRVRRVAQTLPGVSLAHTLVPSADGGTIDHFDELGRHLETVDARTKAKLYAFGYDAVGRLASITDREGNVTTFERDSDGRPAAIVAPHGQRTMLSTDANGYLSRITNPAGESAAYTYDGGGMMQTYRTPRGDVHAFVHDPMGRLVSDADAVGGVKTLARTERGDGYAVTVTTKLGRATLHEVQRLATGERLLTTTAPDGTVSRRTERADGSVSTLSSDGTAVHTTLGPDPRFMMQAPVTTTTVRTPSGLTLSVVESRSAALSSSSDPLSATALGERIAVNGRTYGTAYDAASRTLTATTPAGRVTTTTLDASGKVVGVQAPGVLAISVGYDAAGRVQAVTQGARTYRVEYDAQGYPQTLTDPLQRMVSLTHDLAGRVRTQQLPGSRSVGLDYDVGGNLTSLVPPGRPAHGFAYDSADRVKAYAPPSAADAGLVATTYDYDLDGALASVLLPDQQTVVPGYDAAGRLASVTTARGTTGLGYDAAGRVDTIAAPDGSALTYRYDGSLVTSEAVVGAVHGAVSWTYDNDFRVSSTAVNGSAISYSYDGDSLLTGAGALTVTRNAATRRVDATSLETVATSHGYNAYGEPETFTATAGGATAYAYVLMRDLAGRIAQKQETVAGVTSTLIYGYDAAGRLETVTRDGNVVASYAYDDNGNRLTGTAEAGVTSSGSYDDQDRLKSYGAASYTYGPAGDLRTKTSGGQTTTYSYDAQGNLLGASLPGGKVVEYVVDGRNRRVGKKVDGMLVEGFLYDGQLRPVAWLDGTGAVKATFVYGLHVNVPEYMTTSAGTYRIIHDYLGSPRLVVDSGSGAVVQRMDYDSFGQVLQDTNPGSQPFGFAGGLYDRDTGLVRFGARDYDPSLGRWTNKDPLLFGGRDSNLYEYAAGDPVNLIDPTGLEAQCFAQLKYRPVDDWRAKLFGRTHAFWYVQGSDGQQYILSGGPNNPNPPQYLNVYANSNINGNPDNVSAATYWDSGLSPVNCAGVDKMIATAQGWQQNTTPYSPVGGPNSDTAAHTLGTAGGFNPPAPPGTMGWNTPLPTR